MKILPLFLMILFMGCGTSGDISPWALRTIQIEPSSAHIQPGGHQKFTATVKNTLGADIKDASFVWSLRGTTIAEIDVDPQDQGTAFVTGIASGTVEVRVMSSGASTGAILTINDLSSRPVEVSRVFPEEGSKVSDPRSEITIEISYRHCDCAEDALDTVQLFLDGIDVTEQATWSGTLDIPQSSMEISFVPVSSLLSGMHTVDVQILSKLERSSHYSWSFAVL